MAQKILVVDDDQINVKMIQNRLQSEGYEVSVALNGKVGLDKVRSEHPDMIILDVEMPLMDGFQMKTEINRDAELVQIPVIVLSSHEEMQPIFKMKGVQGYLVKPVDMTTLVDRIKECLEVGHLEDFKDLRKYQDGE